MSGQFKAKVTAKVDYDRTRPASPSKTHMSLSPPPRPKAKVNTSATITARKPAGVVSAANLTSTTRANIPVSRAPSPFKPTQSRPAQTSTAVPPVKAKVTGGIRGNGTIASGSTLPELRQRALTTTPGDSSAINSARARRGSLSSHVSSSPGHTSTRTAPPTPSSRPGTATANEESSSVVSGPGGLRVKSKVYSSVDHTSGPSQSLPASPSFSRHTRPARVPSVSNLSLSPPLRSATSNGTLSLSPSTSGHQRFGSTHDTQAQQPFRPFQPHIDLSGNYTNHLPSTPIDPAHIPLPPHSPPSSTLSFSSRSSASRSSVSCDTRSSEASGSTAPTLHSRVNGYNHANEIKHVRSRSNNDASGIQLSPLSREPSQDSAADNESDDDDDGHDSDDPERKLKNEAKSIRKIADLEITNRSLLAINSMLEATKHKQAKEIRDLRRRLRESILVLPPSVYYAAKSSMAEDGTLPDDDKTEEDDEDEEEVDQAVLEGKTDESYRRVKGILEGLLESGRRALESKPEDFAGSGKGGAKVLSEEEARTWRGDDIDSRSILERLHADDASFTSHFTPSDASSRPLTPSRVAIPDGDFGSEDEVEASLIIDPEDVEGRRSTLPPITVTPSPSS